MKVSSRLNLGARCYLMMVGSVMACLLLFSTTAVFAFSSQEVREALDVAMQYADLEYSIDDELMQGVAYFYGGQDTISSYLAKIEQGVRPGEGAGIDASGLVVNAYRAIYPELKFVHNTNSKETMVADASSMTLYLWNIRPMKLEDLEPGDLIFFGTEGSGINGVSLYVGRQGESVRIVTASQTQGKVVLTGIRMGGDYWKGSFAGAGRLIKR
ncbi:MAG: C40 family peptidase [Firmicutes bacterium]|nr:C40 family peptidase [Bacillota bacterium]